MVMTLATKIMYGAVPGITKAKYHSLFPGIEAFSDMLLDVLSIAKPDLFIMDGIVGMHGNGPKGGEPCAVGALLASDNALAMDVSVCRMLGIEPMEIPLLKRARIRGMAPSEVKYPLLSPEDARFHGFRLPLTAHLFGEKRGMKVPVPNEKCTGCGRCEEICPRGAVKVVGEPWSLKRQTSGEWLVVSCQSKESGVARAERGKARVDYAKCIRCYCCHEVCPVNAICLLPQEKAPK